MKEGVVIKGKDGEDLEFNLSVVHEQPSQMSEPLCRTHMHRYTGLASTAMDTRSLSTATHVIFFTKKPTLKYTDV